MNLQALLIVHIISSTVIFCYNLEYKRWNKTDHDALLAIKSQLIDHPEGVLSSWNHSQHHCDWEGVQCGHRHRRVTVLDLHSRRLSGSISHFVGNVSFLRYLLFQDNKLHGQIPNEIGRLYRLRELHLSINMLVGEIPANLSGCLNLQILDIGMNKLQGNLPMSLGALTKLKTLELSLNNLTGPLFKVIANLTSLEKIYAAFNMFTGNVPDSSVARMRNLYVLGLTTNDFSGVIPPSIFNHSSLTYLELGFNRFHGSLPPNIGQTLPLLQSLYLGSNFLTGPLPVSILNITGLQNLNLQNNSFTNEVPLDFGRLKNLEYLLLSDNEKIGGNINFIISSLTNCSKLKSIGLSGNDLTGMLPDSVANLSSNLQVLGISVNKIRGTIPTGIGNLIDLQRLLLRDNQFTNTIPSSLGKLSYIEQFSFENNRLIGSIPDFFANLSYLSLFNVTRNTLQGNIPSSLWSCQNLLYLDLSDNHLSGNLPNYLFHGSPQLLELNLSYNHFQGSLPSNIKEVNLVTLDLSQNELSGAIPNNLDNLPALVRLFMGGNFFHGSIPSSFASLQSLQQINLSHNNLSGPFPNYLSKFPLEYLDLSYNNFEGEVPTTGVLANASKVSLIENARLCGGIPQLNLPRCMENGSKRRRIPHLLELIILLIFAFIAVVILAWLYLTYHKKKREMISSDSSMNEAFLKVSYNTLHKATDGFSSDRILGRGSFGTVFKGILQPDELIVAVKVLNLQLQGASRSFMAECNVLRNIRHRNLVEIITTCSSIDFQGNDFKALIYKYMSKGNLDKWLHEDRNLSLNQRVDIAINVACALDYLHHDCEHTIVHCDLKPSNILLDDDMVAHVGDFGLAKFISLNQGSNQSNSVGIMGTIGYTAPEYGLGGEASPAGDIYSFGILLLELMTGKRPTGNIFGEEFNLHMYAKAACPHQVIHIVDQMLLRHDNEEADEIKLTKTILEQRIECMVAVVKVGVACSNQSPQDRMNISDAIIELQQARNSISNSTYMYKEYKKR